MMTKMRDNAHVFIIAFAVVFIAFWVVSDIDVRSVFQSSAAEIGKIDGRSISYQEFQQVVDNVAEERRKENQGRDLDENAIAGIREQVWNDFVTQAVIMKAAKQFGIDVSDAEVLAWVTSEAPPEILARHFRDSTGQFNRDQYEQFLRNPGAENIPALVQIEKQLKDEMIRQKLTSILTSSIIVSEEELRSKFMDQSVQLAAKYILFEPRIFAASDTSAPTEEEYASYYKKNKKQFKTKEMRKLKFVLFREVPSAEDSAALRNELVALAEEARAGKDFLELVKKNSEQQYQDTWLNRQMMTPDLVKQIFGQPVGSIIGPVKNEIGYSLYKIMDQRQGAETLIEASHILFRTDEGQNDAEQKRKALAALAQARAGSDFGELAARLSEEPGSAERKGYLGWFGKGRMVKEFEEAAMNAKVGEIVGPVKTNFGYHIIKVTGKSALELKLAEIRMTLKASSKTLNAIREDAESFRYFAGETSFEQEAAKRKLEIQETPEFSIQYGSSYIPNIGTNPALLKFTFENSVGTMSDVYRGVNGYVVAVVSEIIPEGYKPLESVKEQIKPQVVYERQMQKTLTIARRAAKPGATLEQIAASNPALRVEFTDMFTPQAGAKNIGRDDAFIGKILALPQGKRSEPFRGLRGVYVIEVVNKSPFDETAYKVKKDQLRQEIIQQLQNEFIQTWLEEMRERIDVVDNRDRWFR
ncbi:MAG: peptidylprolyl isomerase [Bacteroidota bacterium]|nr:peptidylprolyl isomerase [Bacteroidota bacterium]